MTEPKPTELYLVTIESNPEEGGFDGAIPALKGCVANAKTLEATYQTLDEVATAWLELAAEKGWSIPMKSGGKGVYASYKLPG